MHYYNENSMAFLFSGTIQQDVSYVGHHWVTLIPGDVTAEILDTLCDQHGDILPGAAACVAGIHYRSR